MSGPAAAAAASGEDSCCDARCPQGVRHVRPSPPHHLARRERAQSALPASFASFASFASAALALVT